MATPNPVLRDPDMQVRAYLLRREYQAPLVAWMLGVTVSQVRVLAYRGKNRWELRHRDSFTREELFGIIDDFVERLS